MRKRKFCARILDNRSYRSIGDLIAMTPVHGHSLDVQLEMLSSPREVNRVQRNMDGKLCRFRLHAVSRKTPVTFSGYITSTQFTIGVNEPIKHEITVRPTTDMR